MVRSCFRSTWRLFRNSDTDTPGIFISAPEGSTPYPGWHNLWSRDWVSDHEEEITLGEQPDAIREWHSGASLGFVPAAHLVGDEDCIRNGERWPLAVVPTLIGGFPTTCDEQLPSPQEFLAVSDPRNWCYWAQRVNSVYADPSAVLNQLGLDFGVPPVGYARLQNQGLSPKFVILAPDQPHPWVVVIAGTETALQWIQQIRFGLIAPRVFTSYSTNQVWEDVGNDIANVMLTLGPDPTQPIILVGHSMGAAVACVLAARLRSFAPARPIQLLTIGSPRPGDLRLQRLLITCTVTTLIDEGDVVTEIPLNLREVPDFMRPFVGGLPDVPENSWAPPPNRFVVLPDGTIQPGAQQPGVVQVDAAITAWALGLPVDVLLAPHLPEEYVRRLCHIPQNVPAVFWGNTGVVLAADAPGMSPQEITGSTGLVVEAAADLEGTHGIVGDAGLIVEAAAILETGDDVIPSGMVMAFVGELPPTGWLACDGADYEEADYPELAAILPDVWRTFRGADDPGDGFFRVPLLNGLAIIGVGTGAMNPTTDIRELGIVVGEQATTLITDQMPSHNHTADQLSHRHTQATGTDLFVKATVGGTLQGLAAGTGANTQPGTAFTDPFINVGNTGGDLPHNTMQPSVPLLLCIKT